MRRVLALCLLAAMPAAAQDPGEHCLAPAPGRDGCAAAELVELREGPALEIRPAGGGTPVILTLPPVPGAEMRPDPPGGVEIRLQTPWDGRFPEARRLTLGMGPDGPILLALSVEVFDRARGHGLACAFDWRRGAGRVEVSRADPEGLAEDEVKRMEIRSAAPPPDATPARLLADPPGCASGRRIFAGN